MRGIVAVLAVVLSLALVASAAELLAHESPSKIPGEYIVILHKHLDANARDVHIDTVASKFKGEEKIMHRYAIDDYIGYAAVLSDESLVAELKHPNVRYIEANQAVSIYEGYSTQTGIPTAGNTYWGIDRTDQRTGLNGTYRYFNSGGSGVYAYIIDTGVLITHTEFTGRAIWGFSSITNEQNIDGNGHGTHVAGTIGGITYGLAKQVTVIAVKVLSSAGSGTIAGVVAGVDWTTKNHTDRGRDARSVANMSLGGAAAQALDDAVTASVKGGVNYAIAAGNNNGASACNYSPARTGEAITVGASTNTDARATFSNIGPCVDVFAPGQNILSSWIGSNTATNTISGTSMAAPHAAGVVAVFLGNELANRKAVPSNTTEVHNWIKNVATPDVVTNPGTGSPNLLLFSPYLEPTVSVQA